MRKIQYKVYDKKILQLKTLHTYGKIKETHYYIDGRLRYIDSNSYSATFSLLNWLSSCAYS